MNEKYKPVRANGYYKNNKIATEMNIYIRPAENGEVRVTIESQLDRIEKKMDKILDNLENGDLSTSFLGNDEGFITVPAKSISYKESSFCQFDKP